MAAARGASTFRGRFVLTVIIVSNDKRRGIVGALMRGNLEDRPSNWPARLADGLGLESGLNRSILRPIPRLNQESRFPRTGLESDAGLGCERTKHNQMSRNVKRSA